MVTCLLDSRLNHFTSISSMLDFNWVSAQAVLVLCIMCCFDIIILPEADCASPAQEAAAVAAPLL